MLLGTLVLLLLVIASGVIMTCCAEAAYTVSGRAQG
jgi:hypothetical protein